MTVHMRQQCYALWTFRNSLLIISRGLSDCLFSTGFTIKTLHVFPHQPRTVDTPTISPFLV